MSAPALLHPPRAFAVWFHQLKRWDPGSFHGISWHWPQEVMRPIGSVLRLRKEKVDRRTFKFADLQPITIHFDGSLDRRKMSATREYSMDLQFARSGDIVVAKIDLKNGAVGLVPDGWENVVVTNHFAVYEPDRAQLLPEYFHRVIQSSVFKAHLWRNKVGAEGRKEVKLSFFEEQEIPLPPLAVQQAIVAQWHEAQEKIAAARARVKVREGRADADFLEALGLRPPERALLPKCFAVHWKELVRWSLRYNQLAQTGGDISQGRYPVVELASLLAKVQYGTSEKANSTGEGTPILRINNIKNRSVDFRNLKHITLPRAELSNLTLLDGDILVIRTSGSRDLVGSCAVFHSNDEYVFASYLIRFRLDRATADPDFVACFLNGPLGRQQVDATSRHIMQNNINSEEIKGLRVPLPPLDVQREIIARVAQAREQIAREQQDADRQAREIKADIEARILGTRPA